MSDTSVSFNHPWPEDLIGNLGKVTVGGTPRTSVDKYWGGEVPWMASGDVHLKRITDVPGRITELGLRYSNATLVNPPAVAIGLAGQGKTRGTVALIVCKLCTNQSVALVTPRAAKPSLSMEYLLYNLEFRYEELRSRSAGDGRAGLSKQLIEQIPVPLPPLEEQHKIAEVCFSVDQAIEKTDGLIAKQQRVKAGLMRDFLTRGIDKEGNLRAENTHAFKDSHLGRIPKEWEVRNLGSLLHSINQGWSPDCESEPAAIGEWGVLKTTAVLWEGYQEYENKALPSTLKPRPSLEIRAGDLLMTRAGPNSRVGVISYVYNTRSQLLLSDKLYRLVPNNQMNGRFLCYSLSGFESQRHLSNLKTGMAESQTNISQEIVKALLTVCPPISEQERIADRIDDLSRELAITFQVRAKLHSLKTGLMQDLLTGKKRVTALLAPDLQLVRRVS